MLSDADSKFYSRLFMLIFLMLIAVRGTMVFVGIQVEIPYLDPVLLFIVRIFETIIKGVYGSIAGWSKRR
jgi:small basic protein